MTRCATVRTLAKINLDLRVLHKRADGYHELRTVFQTISLADTIEVEYTPARRSRIELDDPLAIPENLLLRAADAVLAAMRTTARVRFRLTKRIPMGAGLGGGSSDAAAVLLTLPVLAGKRLSLETLMETGERLGSDVPFFLLGGAALGIGRGTELYALPDLKPQPLVLVCPGVHVSTAEAYAALRRGLTEVSASSRMSSFRAYVRTLGEVRSAGAASSFGGNDFQPVIFRRYPQLRAIPRELKRLGAVGASMTGSGSAIFGLFDSTAQRDRAAGALRGENRIIATAALVSGTAYRAMWRRQLREHIRREAAWPPQSRYGSR